MWYFTSETNELLGRSNGALLVYPIDETLLANWEFANVTLVELTSFMDAGVLAA